MPTETDKPSLLVVDDIPANLVAMETMLADMDVNIVTATGGYDALNHTFNYDFALALLDVQMPELDGYQTARMMQSAEHSRHVPIIFVTANSTEESNIEQGYDCGAVDYVTKPINSMILRSKVRIFVELYQQRQQLKVLNTDMEKLVEARTAELSETVEQLKTLGEQLVEQETLARLGGLVAGVAHEINTPVGVAVTAASFLEERTKTVKQEFDEGQLTRSGCLSFFNSAIESSVLVLTNLKRAAELIRSFKQIAVDQTSEDRRCFVLNDYLAEVIRSLKPQLKKYPHTLTIDCPDDMTIDSYPGAYSQIITNLTMNALIHGLDGRDDGEIRIVVTLEGDQLVIRFSDNGKGIEDSNVAKIFDPFFTTRRGEGGSGLGTHIVYNLVTQTLGGTIGCSSVVGEGTTFVITVPFIVPQLS